MSDEVFFCIFAYIIKVGSMSKNFEIRNSTAEFLIFQIDSKEDGIQVVYKDETIWAT